MVRARPIAFCLLVFIGSALFLPAQQAIVSPAAIDSNSRQSNSARLISFSDTLPGQPDGALTVTFALYPDQQGSAALWTETQVVQITNGKYTALLGSTDPNGIPAGLFAADQPQWLAVQANGVETRHLLVSVPYAMKAVEAETFGGLLPSQYVTLAQLQAMLGNSAAGNTGSTGGGSQTANPILTAAASGTTPQPATDFTDNNTSEVLLVTQQGTGYAIHAISAGDAALFAENSSTTGTALKAISSATSGTTTGILVQAASIDGIAGVFDNTAGGAILSLRNSGNVVTTVKGNGDITTTGQVFATTFNGSGAGLFNIPLTAINATPITTPNSVVARDTGGSFQANQITANLFSGDGSGLFNIPLPAINATPITIPNSVVARDFNGSFQANQITANVFSGSGSGLFNIPLPAINATSITIPNSVVARDSDGSFQANQITANVFSGSGSGLFNIPLPAINATSITIPNSVVARDSDGSFQANQITANVFSGSGSGLFNIPLAAINATPITIPNSVVARDFNGSFQANQIMANVFSGSGAGLSSIPNSATTATDVNAPNAIVARGAGGGFTAGSISAADVRAAGLLTNTGVTDFSGGQATLPVKAVLSANTPTNCQASRELLIKTDAPAGQQLFICNATGDGYALVGDGKAAGVTGVMAGDGSVAIGGTASQPTIAVASGGITSDKLAPGAVAGSIPDGSLTPAKITGTAATLGANIFSGNQIVQGSLASASLGTGPVSATSATISGSPSSNLVSITQSGSGSALSVTANGLSAVPAFNVSSIEGDAIHAQATFGTAFTGSSSNGTGIEGTGNNVGIQGNGATALSGNGTNIGVSANASANAGVAVTMTTGSAGKFLSGSSSAGQPFFTETFNVDNVGNIFSAGALSARLPNNAVGTGGNLLARLDGTGGVQHTSITDTSGIIGVVIGGSGTTGNAQIAYSGVVSCSFDTAAVAGDYVVNSSRSAGFCSDGGSAYPASGQVVGRILRSSGTPATIPILLFGSEIRGPAGTISFSQVTGTATAAQLPAPVVYNNQANTLTGAQTVNGSLTVSGQTVVLGTVAAQGFSGDGTSVFNVNAAKLQGFTPGDLASSSALNFETTNRQAADVTLQNNINGLADSINNVSAADAKLAASNSFTAGTQDFSAAGATLPVRAVLSANTPASCVASKELLVKTDATAGQQLFICDASGTSWNLVGDGASGGVSSFNGRSGSVTPAANDYAFSQISGSMATSQLPALTGDVTEAAGTGSTLLIPTGVAAGAYTKVHVDLKGRVVIGEQASFADLVGSASQGQLPVFTVYNNQVNTFNASQMVNGTLTANLFSGNGSGLSNVNAATLNGVPSSGFAQLDTANTFTARQTLAASSSASASLNVPSGSLPNSPVAGDIWNTGGVLQYRDNLSTNRALVSTTQSGGMQLLKVSAAITPVSVASQSCGEQSVNVPGVSTGDVLLAVAQPSTNSPGNNIAIGGWRVPAANTVAIQFCNVSRNNSTPVSGTYTFALMR